MMGWVKLDDNFPDHPKVVEAGSPAAWLYICGLTYSSRFLTDGFIKASQVQRLVPGRSAVQLAERLVSVGLWEHVEGGFRVHDYTVWQSSAADIEAERAKARDRARNVRQKFGGTTDEVRKPEENRREKEGRASRPTRPSGRRAALSQTEPVVSNVVAELAARRQEDAERAAACSLCDEAGWLQTDNGAARCNHANGSASVNR